jgi:hypothetical protein
VTVDLPAERSVEERPASIPAHSRPAAE